MAETRSLDRTSPMPLWAQVLDDLRRRLDHGEFEHGFPPERELIEQYQVSRHTVRDAMTKLREAGVIRRERGRGTFVRPPTIEQPTGALYSLFTSVEDLGYAQRSAVIDQRLTTNPGAAAQLGLAADDGLFYLHRARFADENPIATDEVWLPATVAAPLLSVDFEHTALYAELERRCGVRPVSGWERLSPALATPTERALLGIGSRQPVFVVERLTEWNGSPLEWRRTVVRGDQFAFVTRWNGGIDVPGTRGFSASIHKPSPVD